MASRRDFLTSASAAAASLPFLAERAAAASELAVLTYGGPVGQVETDMVLPVLQRQGISASLTQTTVIAATLASEGTQPKYDMFTENILFIPVYPKIWGPVPSKQIPNSAHVYPELMKAAQGKGVPAWIHSECICYNEEKISKPPALADFTNPKYKGKIVLQASPLTMTWAPLLLAGTGATVSNPEPMFKWFEEVIPNVLTDYTQVTQPAQMFQSGEVWLGLWYSGRASQLRYTANVPITWSKTPQVANMIAMAVTNGSSNPEGAAAFINRWLDPDVQAEMAKKAWFGPVSMNASISKQDAAKLPVYGSAQIARLIQPDWAAIAPHYNAWQARYDALVQKYGRR